MQIRFFAYERLTHLPHDEYFYYEFTSAKARDAFVKADPHRDTLNFTRGNATRRFITIKCREVPGAYLPEGCCKCYKEYGREVC